MKGLDFASAPADPRRFADQLRRDGFGFVVRYLSQTPGKNLTRAEVVAYRNAGLDIVTVYEDTAGWTLGGSAAGHAAAKLARRQLDDLGAPDDAPVYFAVDFDPAPEQMAVVDTCLDATAFVLTEACNGIYGGYAAVSKAQHVRYRWQTAAWSGGAWAPSDEMRQYAQGGVTDGVQWDLDVNLPQFSDFGQWRWALVHRAPVKPKRKPVRKAVKKTAAGTRKVVQKEPVVTAAGASGALSAAVALLAGHAGWHLTHTQLSAILVALPALATLFAAWRARPVRLPVMTGALATIATACLAFGLHWPASYVGTNAAFASAVIALLLRIHVTPAAPAAATPAMQATLQATLAQATHQAAALTP